MRLRATSLTVLILLFVPLHAQAARKKTALVLEVSPSPGGLPLVTLAASGTPLGEVAERLAKKLGTTVDVSPAARNFKVTTDLDQQPLDLTLRELAPQAYLDGILSGGTPAVAILSIHLRSAGEPAPALTQLQKRTTDTVMFFGNTEDPAADPLQGQLEVTYRNDRLRVFGKAQPLSVVVARIAEVLGIPFELAGDSRESINVAVMDATAEQAMSALTPSVKLYFRKDLATFRTTPVRLVLQEPIPDSVPAPGTE